MIADHLNRLFRFELFRFSLVGGVGFLVDAAVLYTLIYLLDIGLLSGRLFSYLAAATATWYLNKVFTFVNAPDMHAFKQWVKFVLTNGVGGVVNYGIYTLLILSLPAHPLVPLLGVMAGSIAGLIFNFTLSRHLVFGRVSP